jgi:hypothetical protein
MTTLYLAATGPTTADEVWERYAQPALWSTWSPQIRRVEMVGDRLSTGATGRVVSLLGLSADFEVDTWDEEEWRWSWTVRPRAALLPGVPMPRLHLGHGVRSTTAGTLTWLRLSGPLPLVVMYAPVARLALHRLVR